MNVEQALEIYNQKGEYPLCKLFDELGCDKGPLYHYYSRFYQCLFEPIQSESFSLFEMGIGTNDTTLSSNMGENGKPGVSLRAWRQFFPNALIHGADVDRKTLFTSERIQTFYCDQRNKQDIEAMWNTPELRDKTFRIMLDDGLHELEACKILFENSIHKLEKGGVYIVEDIGVGHVVYPYLQQMIAWKKEYPDLLFWFFYVEPVVEKTKENYMMVCMRP